MHAIVAGLIYFAIVFGAGFFLGVFRELVLTPVYGKTVAVLIEMPFMVIAIGIGAWIAVHRSSVSQSKPSLLVVGLVGLVLVQIADFGFGLGLRGMSLQDQLAYLKTTAGQIYMGLLAVFMVMPLVVGRFSKGRHQKPVAPDPN